MRITAILFIAILIFSCKKSDSGGGTTSASISALGCASVSFSSSAVVNTAFSATGTVPYSGGNGIAYTAGTSINSTGVTGLVATLQTGTLANGNGNFSYTVTGTPTSAGTATFAISFGGQSCSINLTVNAAGGGGGLPSVYNKIYGATSITTDGIFVTIKTSDQPDHKSAYWATTNPLYEAFVPSAATPSFTGGAFIKAPNNITAQNITLKIPLNPSVAATHSATPMGVMGVALDGVPFFNQYAAGGAPLGGEVNGFDQAWAHPQASGMYHYHVEPYYLTTVKAGSTKWGLMGFLLDGFPVYGPKEENNTDPTGLDVYHGHTHNTVDYPSGIYHYHFSMAAPYLNGNGFYGTAGTVTQ